MKTAFSIFLIAIVLTPFSFIAYKKLLESHYYSDTDIPPIDSAQPEKVETATFSMGCFWGPDSMYGVIDGVIRTRVGYAGGKRTNPTYHNLGNHAETIQIDYNHEKVSYLDLLKIFWKNHSPGTKPYSTQYKSIIFYHNKEQKRLADKTKEQIESEGRLIYTEIRPYNNFYRAEDYHQKYRLLQESKLLKEYKKIYTTDIDFVDSTPVARVNGYISGYGDEDQLLEELPQLGLSQESQAIVLELYRKREKQDTCGL